MEGHPPVESNVRVSVPWRAGQGLRVDAVLMGAGQPK
jgi:hypothetical protein